MTNLISSRDNLPLAHFGFEHSILIRKTFTETEILYDEHRSVYGFSVVMEAVMHRRLSDAKLLLDLCGATDYWVRFEDSLIDENSNETVTITELLKPQGLTHALTSFPTLYVAADPEGIIRVALTIAAVYPVDPVIISVSKGLLLYFSHDDYIVVMAKDKNFLLDIMQRLYDSKIQAEVQGPVQKE